MSNFCNIGRKRPRASVNRANKKRKRGAVFGENIENTENLSKPVEKSGQTAYNESVKGVIVLNSLQRRILTDGDVLPGGILKVDSFLNHQVDVRLLRQMADDFYAAFQNTKIDKILTIEASGIAIACYVAERFDVPLVFAKKGRHKNVGNDVLTAEVFSFTKGTSYNVTVSRKYLQPGERVLVVDDFLANGQAVLGLKKILDEAGCELVGAAIAIEKAFQPGEKLLRDAGIDVKALAVIESMSDDGQIVFRDED